MHVQARLFGRPIDLKRDFIEDSIKDCLFQPLEAEIPTPVFGSVDEARDSLDKLMHAALLLTDGIQNSIAGSPPSFIIPKLQPDAQRLLAMWLLEFD